MRMQKLLLSLALLLAAAASARAGDDEPKIPELSLDDVEKRLGEKGFHVYDCNPRPVFEKGHVPGATWVVYKQLKAADLPSDKGATLVFYCANEK